MGTQQLAALKEKRAAEEQLQVLSYLLMNIKSSLNPWSCSANFDVVGYEVMRKQNGKAEYVIWIIDVEYAGYTWTIRRRFNQLLTLHVSVRLAWV